MRHISHFFTILILSLSAARAETISTGTGFAITFDGVLITNNHVIEGCGALKVSQGQSTFFSAKTVARDKSLDLAALRLLARVVPDGRTSQGKIGNTPRAIIREGTGLRVGEHAITYGFPLRGVLANE
jgi:serine protease Do